MKKARVIELKRDEMPTAPESDKGAIGVGEGFQPKEVVHLANVVNYSHVVQKDGLEFENELKTAQNMTENLMAFIKDPLSVIFGPQAAEPRASLRLTSPVSAKKSETLEKFEEFLKGIKGARKIRDQAMLVADELYTNAIKTGVPHEKMSTAQFARAGTVDFFAEHDGVRLILGCRDSFGELGFSQVLTRIQHCFDKGVVHSINNGEGGAGIGSFMVFNTCISYYCGVEKGRNTVVCVALPLGVSGDELASLPKNIHLVSA